MIQNRPGGREEDELSEWLSDLPLAWLALAVFGATYLLAGILYTAVKIVARGARLPALKAVSPGMLPPLGIVFGLFVAFIGSQVWSDVDRANAAVNREASALSTVLSLAGSFPGEAEAHIRALVGRYIEDAAAEEWPMMARHTASLSITPPPLAAVLQYTLALTPSSPGQVTAQREIAGALENALDARRQRIIVSRSQVTPVKWVSVLVQAVCTLLVIAMIHIDNRTTVFTALGIFATGVAASVLLILSNNHPFAGEIAVPPDRCCKSFPRRRSASRNATSRWRSC